MIKILIADDYKPIFEMYEKIFSLHNYEVHIAVDGADAIKKAGKLQGKMILLDIASPLRGSGPLHYQKLNLARLKILRWFKKYLLARAMMTCQTNNPLVALQA